MNILFIGHEQDLNGASLSLLGIIDEFKKNNDISIHVLTPYKNGKFIEELKKRDIKVVYIKYFRWIIYKNRNILKWNLKKSIYKILNLANVRAILIMNFYVKKHNIDVIHTNSSVINIGAYISKISRVPHVFHIREFGEEDFNMYPILNKDKMLKFIGMNSKIIIAISNSILEKYRHSFEIDKLCMIYNGINEKFLNYKKVSRKNEFEKFNVLIAGRVEEAKGQKEAILAIKELRDRGIENIKLYVVGNGEKSELNRMIKDNNLNDFIEIKEYCDNLFNLRKGIDFELVCSKNEAFGRVTIEAMMSSNPVIGANTGGTKELIIDGVNGFLYRQGDSKDLAEKIIKLINSNEFDKISKNAFETSSSNFTSKKNAENIYLKYCEILNDSKQTTEI